MAYRRDALVAAAELVVSIRDLANRLGEGTVATVGRLDVEPNAINVIPGRVRLTIDMRSPSRTRIGAGQVWLAEWVDRLHLPAVYEVTEDQPVMPMDADLCARLTKLVGRTATSGALHDAAILAPLLPTAMLFVASKDGISHNPAEFSRIEDIAAAAAVLDRLVRE